MLSSKHPVPEAEAAAEHSAAEKAAFARAMYDGIAPGTEAARAVARKKAAEPQADAAVEVLRRIPAAGAPAAIQSEESRYALQLAGDIDQAVKSGDLTRFSPQAQQALLAALCRLYAANDAAGNEFGAFPPQSNVAATDAMILCGEVLKAVNLQVFELGLWLSWSSR
jgi:hypothetical protein